MKYVRENISEKKNGFNLKIQSMKGNNTLIGYIISSEINFHVNFPKTNEREKE